MDDSSGSDDDSFYDEEDYLQKAVELTEPIPDVQRQAYILIVGDSQTGKSMLAWSFTRFPRIPAKRYHSLAVRFENRNRRRHRNSIGLHFFCAPFRSGDEDCFLDNQPPERQPYNLIIYLFDVNRRRTFRNVLYRWHSQVTNYLGENRLPPRLLVGNKIDLRISEIEADSSYETVWTEEGEMSIVLVGAKQYIEVCALAEINTRSLLVKILRMLNVTWEPDF